MNPETLDPPTFIIMALIGLLILTLGILWIIFAQIKRKDYLWAILTALIGLPAYLYGIIKFPTVKLPMLVLLIGTGVFAYGVINTRFDTAAIFLIQTLLEDSMRQDCQMNPELFNQKFDMMTNEFKRLMQQETSDEGREQLQRVLDYLEIIKEGCDSGVTMAVNR